MNNIFFTSDTHYSHSNICKGISKWIPLKDEDVFDFTDLNVMNQTIVDNINNVVKENDILYHMGDWSFGGIEKIEEFRKQLRCKNIIIILGNHDHHLLRDKDGVRKYFKEVYNIGFYSTPNNEQISLIHDPNELQGYNKNDEKENFIIHGHFHSRGSNRLNNPELKYEYSKNTKFLDVGIIGHPEFRPYSFEEVKDLFLNLK